MKTTIKIDLTKSIVVMPCISGKGVEISLLFAGVTMGHGVLTPDQCGALINGIECANEFNAKRSDGVRCHGDLCAGGQAACPTPQACGVA